MHVHVFACREVKCPNSFVPKWSEQGFSIA